MIQAGGYGQITVGGAERDTEAEVAGVGGCRFNELMNIILLAVEQQPWQHSFILHAC